MAWWGTLLGGALGYMFGGPLGALLGAELGRNFDRGIRTGDREHSFDPGEQQRVQAAFFTASFSVMGYIAKTDGRVSRDEISAVESIMSHMQLDAEQRRAAIRLFNEGKQADFPLADVIEQFRRECHRRRNLLQVFMELQITTALADGSIHPGERSSLLDIGTRLGFSHAEIERLFVISQPAQPRQPPMADAYRLLGVSRSASDAEVKKAYRRLMSQHHPDKLIARGLPEEMIRLATEKTQQIKAAYEQIMDSRRA